MSEVINFYEGVKLAFQNISVADIADIEMTAQLMADYVLNGGGKNA